MDGKAEHVGNEFVDLAGTEVGVCRRREKRKGVMPIRVFGSKRGKGGGG